MRNTKVPDIINHLQTYGCKITVSDPYGATANDGITVTINQELNEPPVAVTTDQDVTIEHDGNPVTSTIDGTICASASSDADGDPISYSWDSGEDTECISYATHISYDTLS